MSEPKLPDQVWLLQVEAPGGAPVLLGVAAGLVSLTEADAKLAADRERRYLQDSQPEWTVTPVRVK